MVIKTESEYKAMVQRLQEDLEAIEKQRTVLSEMGLSAAEVERALEPSLTFHEQLKEEVIYYERIKRCEFEALINFNDIGRLLIGLRIAQGISQSGLAKRLDVSEAQVSKDEKNEYHGISVEKAQRIFDALGVTVKTTVDHLDKHVYC